MAHGVRAVFHYSVAPLAGARIEIESYRNGKCVRGVAPLAGARIEISGYTGSSLVDYRRSPRGSED